jgi:flagellar biosynthesis anti-sigma factor FlgM
MSLESITSQRAASAYTDALSRATSATGATATTGASGAPGATPTTTADAVVALSPEAQAFARALAAAQVAPEVRADKVAAMQARIANRGTGIDADALATNLLGGAQ